MQHDVQLRADARLNFHTRSLWSDQPTFEQAERLGLPSYREAVGRALEDRAADREDFVREQQLHLAV